MAGKAFAAADIDAALWNQANFLDGVCHQLEDFLYGWQNNCPDTTTMNSLGYTDTASQGQALQHIGNLATLLACLQGQQSAGNTHNMFNDIAKLRKFG